MATAAPLLAAAFLSGGSALLFETLWFRLTGLSLGNGVWAASVVLGAFMVGLALGNAVAARRAASLAKPRLVYAALEVTIGLLGLGLVFVLPLLGPWMAPVLRPLIDRPLPLNLLRLVTALALMVVPAAAMGATLPILVRALAGDRSFGRLLGRVYGWNTLGAVLGAFAGEAWLLQPLGIRGTAGFAALLNLTAAVIAVRWVRSASAPAVKPVLPHALAGRGRALVAAAFGCGAILLALEVVWLRFIALRVVSTSLTFATVLATVLAGIAAGSFLAGVWLRRQPDAGRHAPEIALLGGALVIATYRVFGAPTPHFVDGVLPTLRMSAGLVLPVAVASGVLFVLLGAALQAGIGEGSRAAGLLTLANTLGAVAGSTLAGFVLLPRLGMDRSFLVLSLAYAMVALAAWRGASTVRGRAGRLRLGTAGGLFVGSLVLFPTGQADANIRTQAEFFARDGSHIVAVREGVQETLVYLRKDLFGEPHYFRLLTNGFSMSGTNFMSMRYMRMFVYLPVALRPSPKTALLVCYGVGNTARALARTESLERIDVVDLSPDILAMSPLVFPPGDRPLEDPRMRVHVQDGRFFLQGTDQHFDLITAEPPPPKATGVVNLYSREYFRLVHDHLTVGGVATHWLPVHGLSESDGKAVIAAFCSVFEDCSLWSGSGLEWILAGSRSPRPSRDPETFTAQWRSAGTAPDLHETGFETPEQLGATFIGDAAFLRESTRGFAPLDDDHPLRLSVRHQGFPQSGFRKWMDTRATQARFEASAFVAERWPAKLRESTRPFFRWQEIVNRVILGEEAGVQRMEDLRRVLTESRQRVLPQLLMETTEGELRLAARAAARGDRDPVIPYLLGLGAMQDRDYPRAERMLAEAEQRGAPVLKIREARALALALSGDRAGALRVAREQRAEFVAWLGSSFPDPQTPGASSTTE
jgi:spermidine synthase